MRRKLGIFFLLLCHALASHAHAETFSLSEAVQMALNQNEQLLQVQQRLSMAEAEMHLAEADQSPQLNLRGDYSQSDLNAQKQKDYLYRLELSQLVGRLGAVPELLDQAQEAHRKAQLDYQKAVQELIFQVRLVFQNILLTQEEIRERRQLESELTRKLERTKRRKEEEFLIQIHVLSAELEVSEQQLELNKLERRLAVDQAELARLLGLDPLIPIEVTGVLPEFELSLDACVQHAKENRTELQDLQGSIERQRRRVHETRWYRLPEFKGYYRYKDVGVDLVQRKNTWDLLAKYDPAFLEKENATRNAARDGWEIGVQFRLPFLEGSRSELLMDQESLKLQRLEYELQGRGKEITVEIHRKYHEVTNARERVAIEQKRVAVQAERLRIIETILESNVRRTQQYQSLTFDDVITVRQEYTNAQRSYYQARRDYAQAQEELRRAMGLTE